MAQRGGVEGAGEVADGLVVGVGQGVEAGAVEGGVERLGGRAGWAAVLARRRWAASVVWQARRAASRAQAATSCW
ncbi:hypothetical protein ACFV1W_31520 [Kitasatospora sp. NPDC059648]|uniref:hypothetical protein n=1 Tax=Kitasatospora sp. NPDC059648 TaxID=3346894 RepID=UPI0036C7538F